MSGKPDGSYFPLSGENVNCENPRRKPVLHLPLPDWGWRGGFWGWSYPRKGGARRSETPESKRGAVFPHTSTDTHSPAQVVHRLLKFRACGKLVSGCKVREYNFRRIEKEN